MKESKKKIREIVAKRMEVASDEEIVAIAGTMIDSCMFIYNQEEINSLNNALNNCLENKTLNKEDILVLKSFIFDCTNCE